MIEQMILSRRPHYLATANVDFIVQAAEDVELRRILFDAHLVLCDGTPVVWASRLLGNRLPERVAGSDLVPLLLKLAAEKGYRPFLLGASPDSLEAAVHRAIAELPEDRRIVVVLRDLEGLSYEEIAEALELELGTVRSRLHRARADLKDKLERFLP
jgi:exopolysaccharide biosynthesis WecB/TagA/CpsF family protein